MRNVYVLLNAQMVWEFRDAEREQKYALDLLQSHDITNLCIKLTSGSK